MTKQYMPGTPKVNSRSSVREQIDNRITVPLYGVGFSDKAELRLHVNGALELIADLTKAVQQFCERGDIRVALGRTEPYSP